MKPEWGMKRTCQSCGVRFYDLHRDPIHCPKCDAVYDPEAVLKTRRSRPGAPEKAAVVKAPVKDDLDAEAAEAPLDEEGLDKTEDEEEDLIEDTSELGEDEDDVATVVDTGEDEES